MVEFGILGSSSLFLPILEINGREIGAAGARERSEPATGARCLTVHCTGPLVTLKVIEVTRFLAILVDLASVPHFDNEDDEFLILDRIQDSPYALPNSKSIRFSRKFFTTVRARIISKLGDA